MYNARRPDVSTLYVLLFPTFCFSRNLELAALTSHPTPTLTCLTHYVKWFQNCPWTLKNRNWVIKKLSKTLNIQEKEQQEEKYDCRESIYFPSHFNEEGVDWIPERVRRLWLWRQPSAVSQCEVFTKPRPLVTCQYYHQVSHLKYELQTRVSGLVVAPWDDNYEKFRWAEDNGKHEDNWHYCRKVHTKGCCQKPLLILRPQSQKVREDHKLWHFGTWNCDLGLSTTYKPITCRMCGGRC